MHSLADQAELALIGALLAEEPPPAEVSYLRAEDFAHRAHGTLFEVITKLRHDYPALYGDALINVVALRADTRGVDASWLADVRNACPEPAHVAAYARMVQAAGFRRDVATHAERIATAAAHTVDVDGQAHLVKLADALARQAEVYAAFHTFQAADPDHVGTGPVDQWRVATEEELLADLLQHPEQASDIAVFVHRDTFTSEQRREVFETLVRLGYDGEDIDEVIVCWEMARTRALTPRDPDGVRADAREPDVALLHRLATTRTTRSAIEAGRDLVADDIQRSLATHLGGLDSTRPRTEPVAERTAGLDPHLHPPAPLAPPASPIPRIER
ncbi:DnaB-like helicase N-terminal domain-containing protein [Spirilliplanes yamanashiensis]|uniref:DNA helicase DnaB-like N-terminal domain-containing protein n=1 Tax=Spirilliplanes yamanashiensis TaxID=42233 RepID=A0A8J4DMP7_9ACTN|nr:DnaB-like helicase N-terminal domain-containing protein [Spirilliplanes yamanashiensis]MDP9818499.1 replicative DNA helicase [Spirilliplanes yamanashiensis]GIJ06375.1 hypothetical protein Sya03_57270 [Spirilliplanes yamanashiensis]